MAATVMPAGNAHAIPFQEREEHLAAAMQWLEGEGPAPSVRIITGRAGQGKTRLGMEIAARARKRGWLAGFLPAGGPDLFPATEFRTVWHQPTLVIIDNAATRTTQVRTWLTAVLRQKPGAHPLRFLLLERTGLDDLWLDSIFGATEAGSPCLPPPCRPRAGRCLARWPARTRGSRCSLPPTGRRAAATCPPMPPAGWPPAQGTRYRTRNPVPHPVRACSRV
ncbi:hypothetical protein RAA17_12715 [Komagataeibacter rhaeticus]|nr:hypothetical protein [Komagataeibacter rhaeticus]